MKKLSLNAIAHFLVDAVCLAMISSRRAAGEDALMAILLYNTLAFSLQCWAGWCMDRVRRLAGAEVLAMLVVAAGFFLPGGIYVKTVFCGLGNCFFHVAGGAVTLLESEGKAAPLGVFVAPGAIGVTLGTLYPQGGAVLSIALAACALLMHRSYKKDPVALPELPVRPENPVGLKKGKIGLGAALLTAAVAVRAIGGSAVSFPWKTGAVWAVILTVSVFAGKFLGGFVCDRLGAARLTLISMPAAALFTAFFSENPWLSLAGQLLLNLSMPVALWLLYRLLPEEPGFAFGLAASVLWPGAIIGSLFKPVGLALWLCIIVSFGLGIFPLLYGAGIVKYNYKQEEKK